MNGAVLPQHRIDLDETSKRGPQLPKPKWRQVICPECLDYPILSYLSFPLVIIGGSVSWYNSGDLIEERSQASSLADAARGLCRPLPATPCSRHHQVARRAVRGSQGVIQPHRLAVHTRAKEQCRHPRIKMYPTRIATLSKWVKIGLMGKRKQPRFRQMPKEPHNLRLRSAHLLVPDLRSHGLEVAARRG